MPDKRQMLRIMYWYNIVVTGCFSLVIGAATLFPEIGRSIFWNGFDPITASLAVPLFIVIAVFCALSLKDPERGKIILQMQVCYKPASIALVVYFAARHFINPVWAAVVIVGLIGYIAGNVAALRRKHE